MRDGNSDSIEAQFHKQIKAHLNRRQQGLVMAYFRGAMAAATVQLTAPPKPVVPLSCSCADKCVQTGVPSYAVTIDCKRSSHDPD